MITASQSVTEDRFISKDLVSLWYLSSRKSHPRQFILLVPCWLQWQLCHTDVLSVSSCCKAAFLYLSERNQRQVDSGRWWLTEDWEPNSPPVMTVAPRSPSLSSFEGPWVPVWPDTSCDNETPESNIWTSSWSEPGNKFAQQKRRLLAAAQWKQRHSAALCWWPPWPTSV